MERRLKAKSTNYGLVEVMQRSSDGWYLLYVNGSLREQSADLNYILNIFDQY